MHASELNQRLAELEAALIKYVERYGLTDQARAILSEPELGALPCLSNHFTLPTDEALGRSVVQVHHAMQSITAPARAQVVSIVEKVRPQQE
jgi:hypothetical protein